MVDSALNCHAVDGQGYSHETGASAIPQVPLYRALTVFDWDTSRPGDIAMTRSQFLANLYTSCDIITVGGLGNALKSLGD